MKLIKKQFSVTAEPSCTKSHSIQLARLLCIVLIVCGNSVVTAAPASDKATPTDEPAAKSKPELPIPKEESSVTRHDVKIGDQNITYTATAGNLLIRKGDDP